MLIWCRRCESGYDTKFRQWIKEKHPEPYNSYGNGAAMRVSATGRYYETREVTHNHFEGMKGATKDEIKNYIEREFDYVLSRTIEEMRPTYHHVERPGICATSNYRVS